MLRARNCAHIPANEPGHPKPVRLPERFYSSVLYEMIPAQPA